MSGLRKPVCYSYFFPLGPTLILPDVTTEKLTIQVNRKGEQALNKIQVLTTTFYLMQFYKKIVF